MRNNILILITVLLLSLAGTEVSASGVPRNAESKTGYAPIHGMQLDYEIHGQGKPMVLLHDGITAFEGLGTNIDASGEVPSGGCGALARTWKHRRHRSSLPL